VYFKHFYLFLSQDYQKNGNSLQTCYFYGLYVMLSPKFPSLGIGRNFLVSKAGREIRHYRLGDHHKSKAWLSELGRFYNGYENGRFVDQLVNKEHGDKLG